MDDAARERAEQSLAQLEGGGLPVVAEERLRQLAAAEGKPELFSSDLSVQEFTQLAGLGVKPLTQVMGSSIYQVGWQPTYYNAPTEVRVLSDAYNQCRALALGRLLQEARLARADAVVGLRIVRGAHDWAAGAIEFIGVGTAVRLEPHMRHPAGEAVLTDLSGQEFAQLCRAGIRPVGIVAHSSVHYVPASWQTQLATTGGLARTGWINQELGDFTQGVYDAREKAISAASAQARTFGADGIVGVKVSEQSRTHHVRGGMYEREDLVVTFEVMGTAIREEPAIAGGREAPAPLAILSLADHPLKTKEATP